MQGRRCHECNRPFPEVAVPPGASYEAEQLYRRLGTTCRWCIALNLLGGGLELDWLDDRFSPEDAAELRARGARLLDERLALHGKRRRRREKPTEAQGALV